MVDSEEWDVILLSPPRKVHALPPLQKSHDSTPRVNSQHSGLHDESNGTLLPRLPSEDPISLPLHLPSPAPASPSSSATHGPLDDLSGVVSPLTSNARSLVQVLNDASRVSQTTRPPRIPRPVLSISSSSAPPPRAPSPPSDSPSNAPVLSKASSKRRQLAAIPEEIDVATHEFDECLGAAEITLVPSQDVYPVDESGEVIMDERERSYLKRYSMDARRLVRGYLTQSESIGAKYPGYNDLPNGCICPQASSVSTFANMLEMMFGEGDLERGAGRKPKPKPVCIRSDLVTPTRSSLSVFDVHNIY